MNVSALSKRARNSTIAAALVGFSVISMAALQPVGAAIGTPPVNTSGSFTSLNGAVLASASRATQLAHPAQPAPGSFTSVTPQRLFDTHTGLGAHRQPVARRSTITVQVAGRAGIPVSGVSAIAITVTTSDATRLGSITAYGDGSPRPAAASMIVDPTTPRANLLIVPVGPRGKIVLSNNSGGSVALFGDVAGYFRSGPAAGASIVAGGFVSIAPRRVYDYKHDLTLNGQLGSMDPDSYGEISVANDAGITTSGVSALVLQVSGQSAAPPGRFPHPVDLAVAASGFSEPFRSVLTGDSERPLSNTVVVPVGPTGNITLHNKAQDPISVSVDVIGYYRSGPVVKAGAFTPSARRRIYNDAAGPRPVQPLAGRSETVIKVTGAGRVPTQGVSAVAIQLSPLRASRAGYLTAYANGTARPHISQAVFSAGRPTTQTEAIVPVGADGRIRLFNGSTAPVTAAVDIVGYYRSADSWVEVGRPFGWGDSSSGQVLGGHGASGNATIPTGIPSLSDTVAVAGGNSSLALTIDGRIAAWGPNAHGERGNGTSWPDPSDPRDSAVTRVRIGYVRAIAAGDAVRYAVRTDGSVWMWGQDSARPSVTYLRPVKLAGLHDITAVATKGAGGYALRKDGTVWAWGPNVSGQLGNGSRQTSFTPVRVRGLDHVIAIAAGSATGYAVRDDGRVWAWGSNDAKQLGWEMDMQNKVDSAIPVRVGIVLNAIAIAATNSSVSILASDGTVESWGSNSHGQIGFGQPGNRSNPTQAEGLFDVASISAGGDSVYAVTGDGSLYAWGRNDHAQLGNNSLRDSFVPVRVTRLHSVTSVGAGTSTAYALVAY